MRDAEREARVLVDAARAAEGPTPAQRAALKQKLLLARAGVAPGPHAAPVRSRRRAWRVGAVAALAAAAIVAAVMPGRFRGAQQGDVVADGRREVHVGGRAVAVLEAGAEIHWKGERITQSRGAVFWRVEPGAPLVLHSPGADVRVLGTCFRVDVTDADGPSNPARALVGVYEGTVAVSLGSDSVVLGAGRAVASDGHHLGLAGPMAQVERDFRPVEAASEGRAAALANHLADARTSVAELQRRLDSNEEERARLVAQLDQARKALGEPFRSSEWDLSQDDWRRLDRNGDIRFRLPCQNGKEWGLNADEMEALGLAPEDAGPIATALASSYKRTWGALRAVCAQVVGGGDLADRVGELSCLTLVVQTEKSRDLEAYEGAIHRVTEAFAGVRPMPGPDEPLSPFERAMLTLTAEPKRLEADLAQTLGPDDAKRVVYSDQGCWNDEGFGVGPRKP